MADQNRVVNLFNATRQQFSAPGGPPPGGPTDGDLAARIRRLEDALQDLKDDSRATRETLTKMTERLASIDGRLTGIDGRLTGIEGRFSAMPTALQLLGFAVAVIVASGLFRMFDRPVPTPTIIQQPASPR